MAVSVEVDQKCRAYEGEEQTVAAFWLIPHKVALYTPAAIMHSKANTDHIDTEQELNTMQNAAVNQNVICELQVQCG